MTSPFVSTEIPINQIRYRNAATVGKWVLAWSRRRATQLTIEDKTFVVEVKQRIEILESQLDRLCEQLRNRPPDPRTAEAYGWCMFEFEIAVERILESLTFPADDRANIMFSFEKASFLLITAGEHIS